MFSHRSIYQAFQGFLLKHWRLLHPDCLFLVSSTVSMLSHRGEFNKKQDKYVWYKNLLTWTGAHSADDEYQNKITY